MKQFKKIIKQYIPRPLLDKLWNAKRKKNVKDVFTGIYNSNAWESEETVSGPGSGMDRTEMLRSALPGIFAQYRVKELLDLPCGDFNWFRTVDLSNIRYTGADIVDDLIRLNNSLYKKENIDFRVLDIIHDPLPQVDMIFCRDCLVHLPDEYILRTIGNVIKSRSRLLVTTTYPSVQVNTDMFTGGWRPVNLMKPPFNFPEPLELINDGSRANNEINADKKLGIWEIKSLVLPEIIPS